MKEVKNKVTEAQLLMFLFFIEGIVVLVLNKDGSSNSVKINWGIGVGLIVGSMTYFVNQIVVEARARHGDNQIIQIILMMILCAFLVPGFIELYGYGSASDNGSGSGYWRLLGLGTCLTVGGFAYLANHAGIIKQKTWRWIIVVAFVIAIVGIVVESLIT